MEDFDENFENNGVTAIALYDYQAAADDEISFDPSDIITNIEMVSNLNKIRVNRTPLIIIYSFTYQLPPHFYFLDLLHFRLMMDGGWESAMASLAFSQQTTLKLNNSFR